MGEADRAQIQIDSIRRTHTTEFPGEEVCEACGMLYLLTNSGDHRQQSEQEHFASESHKGYVKAREKLTELRELVRKKDSNSDRDREKGEKKHKKEKDGRGEDEKERSKARDRKKDE